MSIIGAEDEFFENDLEQTVDDQCSHFNSIELLKDRPTHLLVFLQHVMLQFDCLPLLCYLHADLLKNLSAKETKKQFMDFVNTFLDKGAILRVPVPVPGYVSSDFDRPRPELEDAQKRYVMDVQAMMVPEIMRQLEDFRQKRMMGMTPSEQELMEVENHHPTERIPTEMKEKAMAENLLEKLSDIQPTIGMEEEKYAAIFTAVVYYMKHLGVKSRTADSKKSRGFFRKKNPLRIFEDSTKSKQRFPNIPWIGGSNDVKPSRLENEGEKEKVAPPSRVVVPEPTPAPPIHRKSGANAASLQVPESSDGLGVNNSLTSNPDSSQTDTGPSSSRPDAHPAMETGDVSPAILRLSVWEPPPPNETPPEDSQDGDSSDSGASPLEGPLAASSLAAPQEEVEPRLLELEQDPPNWREQASSATLSNLSKKEIKRQEVINELFLTEHAHVRMLTVLQNVFFRPLERKEIMTLTELAAIFPSLDEIIEMHYNFYDNLKNLRQEGGFIVKTVGTTLLNRFSGAEGDWFQKLTARFCSHQSYALDQIKGRQKKDPQFNAFIQEAESKPECRRLQLKDIIPIEMQRLTKYPLLLENIAKSTEDKEEKESVQQAAECCRKILNHVNEEVKDMENLLTLKDYQRRLDTSGLKPSNDLYLEYKNIDLTQRKMIYEGPLTWRVTKEKALDIQCVLLGDLLVLLQKQDDKMVLKCQSKSNTGVQEGKQMLSPIIKLDSVFLRDVATDRKAFYVIFTWDSGAQIYELVAHSVVEMKNWTARIKGAVSELKRCGGSILGRKSIVLPGAAYSSSANQTSNSSSENGGVTQKASTDRDGDSLSEGRGGESPHVLMDHLLANGFDLIAHSNAPQEKVASDALENIKSLRQLVGGGAPEDAQPEVTPPERDEGAEPDSESCPGADKEDGPKGDAEVKAGQDGGTGAPTVISVEKMEEVQKQLNRLETHLRHLQSVEDEHHRLQELLSKFLISGAHLQ